jgi:hypothetical protein
MPAPPARSGDIYAQPRPLCFAGDLALDRGPGTSCSSSADVAGTGGELPQRKRSSMPKLHTRFSFRWSHACFIGCVPNETTTRMHGMPVRNARSPPHSLFYFSWIPVHFFLSRNAWRRIKSIEGPSKDTSSFAKYHNRQTRLGKSCAPIYPANKNKIIFAECLC